MWTILGIISANKNISHELSRKKVVQALILLGFILSNMPASAVEMKDLPYPGNSPDANTIARQVFYVNRLFAFSNLSLKEHPKGVTVIVDQVPGKKQKLTTVERHVNNTYKDGEIASRELSIFRSGKLEGAAILLTDYKDPNKAPNYTLWLPIIRRTRVIEISDTNDTWGGTVFTYAEMLPNNPDKEKHELLGTKNFTACLSSVSVDKDKGPRWGQVPDKPVCDHIGKTVYLLKSKPDPAIRWYDYRIAHIDTQAFADYRTEYYKDGAIIKLVDRDWRSAGKSDPRAMLWHHIYGKNFSSGHETYIVVPDITLAIDTDKKPSFWSERSLKTIDID